MPRHAGESLLPTAKLLVPVMIGAPSSMTGRLVNGPASNHHAQFESLARAHVFRAERPPSGAQHSPSECRFLAQCGHINWSARPRAFAATPATLPQQTPVLGPPPLRPCVHQDAGPASRNRHGHRDSTMILVCYRHGLRVSELVGLEWSQVDFNAANLFVRRLKGSTDAVHPARGDELRVLRRLQREQDPKSVFVFVSKRGSPHPTRGRPRSISPRSRAQISFMASTP